MAASLEGRSVARIKRKPPPAFPYSPRYPHPDPSDPFAPLQVLRERAHSAQANGTFLNHSNTSLVPSAPSTGDSHHFAPQLPPDLRSPPRALLQASRSIELFEQFRDGYHSDIQRPPRPPRARTRPARDSKAYFSDLESSVPTNHRHHDENRHPSEKVAERQYHYRRRSQTLSFFPAASPQVPTSAEEREQSTAQERDVSGMFHHRDQTSHPSKNQYVYDDRQSHGHVYGQTAHEPHPSSTVDSHIHSHVPTSVHSGPTTPPMTPDDTMTLSSVSVRDRSDSVLSDIALPHSKHVNVESDVGCSSLETGGRIEREHSRIRTSDFPALLGSSEPDSPPPIPVPPPRPPPHIESEPEQDYLIRRRSGFGARERKESFTKLLRRSSLLARGRKVSDPSPPSRTRRLPPLPDSDIDPPARHPSHLPSAETSASAIRHTVVPEVLRTTSITTDSSDKKRTKMSHRKSLSHVSLGVTPLPNLSFGATSTPVSHVENVSMASTLVAYPDGDEYGGPAPVYPATSQHDSLVKPQPQFQAQPQTLAQALELTPLPPKDAPLPLIRKDTRLPAPPAESCRSSRTTAPAQAVYSEYDRRRETQLLSVRVAVNEDPAPEVSAQTTYGRPLTPVGVGRASSEMEMDEIILMRSSHFEPSSEYGQEQSSPSPPLLVNSLLVRPTSAATAISLVPAPTSVPLISPAPISPQINVTVVPVSVPSVRPELAPRRASSPPPPPPPPRRGPSPPAPRRPPSPPPRAQDDFGPPTPAPLPLSPPRRMDADLDTPLPQPPLPPPPPQPAPRARSPVHIDVERSEIFTATSASVLPPPPPRPRSPQETRQRRSDERHASEDRQERTAPAYLPVAQVRPNPPPPPPEPLIEVQQLSGPASRSRSKVSQPSTPYNSVRQRRAGPGQGSSQPVSHMQLPFRPQSPSTNSHIPARAQTPQAVAVVRTQLSVPVPARTQSPQPVIVSSRAVSPPPFRAQSPPVSPPPTTVQQQQQPSTRAAPPLPPPPPASYNSHSHSHTQGRPYASQPSSLDHDIDRDRDATRQGYSKNASGTITVESTVSPPYATSVESMPQPLPNTPSTTFSYPPRTQNNASRRAQSTNALSDTAATRPKSRTGHHSRRHQEHRRKEESSGMTFDEHAELTKDQIQKAAAVTVIAQNGVRVQFGDLFKDRKTIVIFIRHFWCANCQDYMYSISRNVNLESLKRAGIDMIVVGNGSPAMIKSYRNIFRTPIPFYTDPTLRVYAALGMTHRTQDPGPDSDKGEYVRHGPIGGLAMVVRNAICVGMPVWEKGGDAMQLGGEFVLGPGIESSFAHRMTTTRSHAPIREVLRAAGYHRPASGAAGGTTNSRTLPPEDEDVWMEERRRSLARMRARREKRREVGTPGGIHPELYEPELGYGSDTGSGSVSANGSWVSSVEKDVQQPQPMRHGQQPRASQERVRPRERRTTKVVSNPDEHDRRDRAVHKHHAAGGRVHVAHHDVSPPNEWSGGTPTLAYINQYGRREDGYVTDDGALSYNYRQD